jgi:hypothetical protein
VVVNSLIFADLNFRCCYAMKICIFVFSGVSLCNFIKDNHKILLRS